MKCLEKEWNIMFYSHPKIIDILAYLGTPLSLPLILLYYMITGNFDE